MLLRSLAQFVVVVCAASLGQDVENRLRSDLFAQVMRLRFRWHDENRSGKTIARSLRDMEKAKGFFREVAFGWIEIGLVVIGVVILSFVTHWTYGATLGLLFLVAFLATLVVGSRIGKMDRAVSDAYDRVTTSLQENVAGARVVRAFGREPEEIDRFECGWARSPQRGRGSPGLDHDLPT
jgi:ATP-binding cassette subfamily B protein